MKIEYPKWIYHPDKEAYIIEEGPIPFGWYASPADFGAEQDGADSTIEKPGDEKPRRGRKPKQ